MCAYFGSGSNIRYVDRSFKNAESAPLEGGKSYIGHKRVLQFYASKYTIMVFYYVAQANEYLVKTGMGIDEVQICRKCVLWVNSI
jgi:hypothetical protein